MGCLVVEWSALDENDDRYKQLKTLQREVQLCFSVRLKEVPSSFTKHFILFLQLFVDTEEGSQQQKENSRQNVTVKYPEFQYQPQLIEIIPAVSTTRVEAVSVCDHV